MSLSLLLNTRSRIHMGFIYVGGISNLTRLGRLFDADDLLSTIQLPDYCDSPNEARMKYYKISIQTDIGVSNGLLYFPSLPANLDDIMPSNASQNSLYIYGPISFVDLSGVGMAFVVIVESYHTPHVAHVHTMGILSVAAEGLFRRIQDSEFKYPPIFEYHLQNECAYTKRKYSMEM